MILDCVFALSKTNSFFFFALESSRFVLGWPEKSFCGLYYVRKIKDKLPHVKQGNSKQGRILFVKEGLMDAYPNVVGKTK